MKLGWFYRGGLAIAVSRLCACTQPECTRGEYGNAECRVLAENELARLRTGADVEIRFQHPGATDDPWWIAGGNLAEPESGRVTARVAGPGDFAISVRPGPTAPSTLEIELSNVDPQAVITLGPVGQSVVIPVEESSATRRRLKVDLGAGGIQWIRGHRPCPDRFRLAITSDIQTNPWQFERIVERIQQESVDADADGQPLVGLVILGDLSEASRDDEFEVVERLMAQLPIPVAVTAGNHDIYRPLQPQFNRHFGPGNYGFNICDARVVLLDTGSGSLAPSVQAQLPDLLERRGARFLLAGMHHAPYPGITGGGWSREDQAAQVLVELAAAGVDLVAAGHTHALHDFPRISIGDRTVHEVVVGTAGAYQGLGVPRYGYLRVSFEGDAMTSCFVEVPPPGYAAPVNKPVKTLDYCDSSGRL